MVKKKLLGIVSLIIMILACVPAYAVCGVYDEAGLLYDTEAAALQMELVDLAELTGWDVAVVTTDNTDGKTSVLYVDDTYNALGCGDNGVLYLLDMDNRELYISTAGKAADYLTDSRIENIFDNVVDYASQGRYYLAMSTQISMTVDYYNAGIPVNQEAVIMRITVLAAGAIIGIIAAVMAVHSVLKSYGFKEVGHIYEYNNKTSMNLTVNNDRLVNSFVTTRIRPRQRNNGRPGGPGGGGEGRGGSSMHRSSSGRMHGGGGRRF
ncbi:MAG: TPM domain-containing protein [Clostridiales bacterium]|nr:TPM domain-containing protein [Clostridiales bacterium]